MMPNLEITVDLYTSNPTALQERGRDERTGEYERNAEKMWRGKRKGGALCLLKV